MCTKTTKLTILYEDLKIKLERDVHYRQDHPSEIATLLRQINTPLKIKRSACWTKHESETRSSKRQRLDEEVVKEFRCQLGCKKSFMTLHGLNKHYQ